MLYYCLCLFVQDATLRIVVNVVNLFNEPAVRHLFYMMVILISSGALLIALEQRMRAVTEHGAGRYALAAGATLWAWTALMIATLVGLLTNNLKFVPPLDRGISLIVIVVIGWAFATADQRSRPLRDNLVGRGESPSPTNGRNVGLTFIAIVLVIITLVGLGISVSQWLVDPSPAFNGTMLNQLWIIGTLAILVFQVLILLTGRKAIKDVAIKVVFFSILALGYGYTLNQQQLNLLGGDEVSAVKLAFLAAMPIFPAIIYRFVIERFNLMMQERLQQNAEKIQQKTMQTIINDNHAERDSVVVLKALGQMLERENPEDLPQQIVVAINTTLKSDVAALLVLDDEDYADVIAAYDSVQRRPIAAMALKLDEQPTLLQAIAKKEQRMVSTDRNLNELVDLYTRLDIQKVGPAYFQPLTRDGNVVGVLVIALPYTGRIFRDSEIRLLDALAPLAARLLAVGRTAHRARVEMDERSVKAVIDHAQEGNLPDLPPSAARAEMQSNLEVARTQINDLTGKVRDLQIELDYERSRIAELGANDSEGLSITQRLGQLSAERLQLEAERERLLQAMQEAQTQLATVTGDDEEMYDTMRMVLRRERDDLQSQKEKLESELGELRSKGSKDAPDVLRGMLNRLSEDKARLAIERDMLKGQLGELETQLAGLGIEGGTSGLTQMILQLTDERGYFKAMMERMTQERDTLLAERQRISQTIANESQRDAKIANLEQEVTRLAGDREALARQRDTLRAERDKLHTDQTQWESFSNQLQSQLAHLKAEFDKAVYERNRILTEAQRLLQIRTELLSERDKLAAERTVLVSDRDQLLARINGNREAIKDLSADGVGTMRKMIEDLTEERSELEHRAIRDDQTIQKLRDEINKLKNQFNEVSYLPVKPKVDQDTAEVMLSIAQELRTPMSSIGAYVDLLLGESVGILGALQRQFLTRVKSNADRLGALIEDFIRVTAIDSGQMALKPADVDLEEIINDALNATRSQFRDRNITLKYSIQEGLPQMLGDRDALLQIFMQLLTNAYLASPVEGEVVMTAKLERKHKLERAGVPDTVADVIAVTIRDYGGGVPAEEQSRVFSRLYRADNPLIQGLGDTGVGLSIARALVEAHGGKIWLESVKGVSSTFKLVIPIEGTM